MDALYIVIPAYNEGENIAATVREWIPVVVDAGPESHLVIINDGSKDNTLAILRAMESSNPQLMVLDKPNGGHGAAIYYGYKAALNAGADYVFQTDSDRQTLPEEFKPFWAKRHNFDACMGVRTHRQDGFSRVLVTWVLRVALGLTFGINIPDSNVPFRLMRAQVLAEDLALIPESHNLINVMLATVFCARKRHIAWIPITFRPRQGGVNSVNFRKIIRIGFKAVCDFLAFRKTLAAKVEAGEQRYE